MNVFIFQNPPIVKKKHEIEIERGFLNEFNVDYNYSDDEDEEINYSYDSEDEKEEEFSDSQS